MKNGIPHIINDEKHLKTIAIGGWFTKGSFYDQVGKEGVHHFLEHILFNTAEIRNYSNALKEKGFTTNAFTSQELMCFYVVCTEDGFSLAYDYIDYVLHTQMDLTGDIGIETERSIIKREIEYHYNYIEEVKKELLNQMFGQEQGNFGIMGSQASVDSIDQWDIIQCYQNLFQGNKFITVAGDSLHIWNRIGKGQGVLESKIYDKTVKVLRVNRYQNDGRNSEYCYYGISRFFNKHQRYAGQVYGEYLKEILHERLREEKGLTYRISTANMNLSGGLVVFWIFKIRSSDLEVAEEIIRVCFKQKVKQESLAACQQRLCVQNLIRSDNVTSEMLSLGYDHTILQGENSDRIDFNEFSSYMEDERGNYYQRIIGIGS